LLTGKALDGTVFKSVGWVIRNGKVIRSIVRANQLKIRRVQRKQGLPYIIREIRQLDRTPN
jgi:hypothetical protein